MRKVCLIITAVLGMIPVVGSIVSAQVCNIPTPTPIITNQGPVIWAPVTFSGCHPQNDPMVTTDFQLVKTGTADGTVSTVTKVGPAAYIVEVSGCTGDGKICVKPADGALLSDADETPLSFEDPSSDDVFCIVDNTAPSVTISKASDQSDVQEAQGTNASSRRIHFRVWFEDANSVGDNGFGPEDIIVKDMKGNEDLAETKPFAQYNRSDSIFSSIFSSGKYQYNRRITVTYSDPMLHPDDYPLGKIGRMYDVWVEPRRDCNVQIKVAEGVTSDSVGNVSAESVYSPAVTFNDAPEVRIERVGSDTSNNSTLNFKVEFSEPVNGFGTGDVWLEPVSTPGSAGGTKTAVVTGSLNPGEGGTVFNVAVSGMTYPGFVRIRTGNGTAYAKTTTTSFSPQYSWQSSAAQVDYDGTVPGEIHVNLPSSGITPTGSDSGSYTTSMSKMDIGGYSTDAFGNADFTWSNNRGGSGSCFKAATLISAPSITTTHLGPIIYLVSYPGATNVTLASGNVTLIKTGTANGVVTVSGDNPRAVVISNVTGTGTLGISISAGTASFPGGLSAPAADSAQSVTVTSAVQQVKAFIHPPAFNGGSISYEVTYSDTASAITLTAADVTLLKTGTADGFVTVSSNIITISDLLGTGTLGVAIAGSSAPAASQSNLVALDGTNVPVVYGGQMNWVQNGIALKPGENIITLSADDAAGNKLDYQLTVNCTNPYWIDPVDTAGTVGTHTSLALDDAGNPRISYYYANTGDLRYASWNGQSWTTQVVDGTAEAGESANVGYFSSLALDSDGNPHISYYDTTNGDLKYAYWKNNAWYRFTVAGESGPVDNVGQYSSLALDSLGRPHIAYYDVTNNKLMYVYGSSVTNPIWSTPVSVDPTSGMVGQYCSIALNPVTNIPSIAYYDATHSSLKYAVGNTVNPTSFTFSDVDTGSVGRYTSLKFDSSGVPHISYYAFGSHDLKYAVYDADTASWSLPPSVDTLGDVGQFSSLALDSDGNPHISYYDATNGDLKYAVADSDLNWILTTLDDGMAEAGLSTYNVGQYCSLKLDSSGNPHISYYDVTNGDLKYLFKSGSGGAGDAPTCVVTGPASPTNASPVYFDMTFSSAVTGLQASSIVVTGGTKGALTEIAPNNGTKYRLAVTPPAGGGQVSCYVPFGAARADGLDNLQSNTLVVTYDGTRPSVTIDRMYDQADPTGGLPIHFTIVFTESVTGFTGSDVVISGSAGGTKSVILSGSGTTYDAAVYGVTTAGSVIASVPAGAAADSAGNTNTASSGSSDNTVWYDAAPPTVTINQASGQYGGPTQNDPTKESTINFTAVFSEPVAGFEGDWVKTASTTDIDIDNKLTITGTASFIDNGGGNTKHAVITHIGTPDAFGHYRTYNVAVSGMTSRGTVIASIPAEAAYDIDDQGQGINNSGASTSDDNSVSYDETRPTVTINQKTGQADPTNASPIRFEVIFSKDVTDFTSSDIVLSGTATGTLTKVVTGGPKTYTVEVSGMQVPSGQTTPASVIATIQADVAHDSAGNGNQAATSDDNVVWFDNARPTVTIAKADTQSDSTYAAEINYTVTFSEPVTGFGIHRDATTNDIDVEDILLSGTAVPLDWKSHGSGWDYVVTQTGPGDGTTYNVKVTGMDPDVPGTVIAEVGANSSQDTLGNLSKASAEAADPSLRQASVLYFPEHCNDTDISIQDNSASGIESMIDLSDYSGTITDLNVKLSITHTYDSDLTGTLIGPDGTQVTLFSHVGSNGANFTNTVFDDQALTAISIGTAPFTGSYKPAGTLANFAGKSINGVWTLKIVDSQSGHVGKLDSWCLQATIVSQTGPSVTINKSDSQTDPTQDTTINFTVVFSKPVTDFEDNDVTIGGTAGATTAAVTGSGATYNVAVSGMTKSGTVTASINADVAVDANGIGNLASTSTDNSVQYETQLTTTIASTSDTFTTAPVTFTVTFSKPVSDFTKADVTIGGTAHFASGASISVAESGSVKMVYTVSVSGMSSVGTVTAKVSANMAHDSSGFGNTASGTASANFAPTIPTVTITQADDQEDPTRTEPIYFTAVFSEPVTGFTNADVMLSGDAGAASVTVTDSGDQTTYTVAVSGMTGSGNVIASVIANAAVNSAGIGNTASPETSETVDNVVYYDTTPTVTINQADGQSDPTNASAINFTAVFSSAVTGFTSEDVLLGGTAGAKTVVITDSGDHKAYNVSVGGMTANGSVIASIPAGAAKDSEGQDSLVSTSTDNEVTYDHVAPAVTVALANDQSSPVRVSPVNFAVTFSEKVVGFTGTSVSTSGSTVGGTLMVSTTEISPYDGTSYKVTITGMSGEGTVKLAVGAGKVTDEAGNGNLASTTGTPGTTDTVYFDNVAPVATVDLAVGQDDPTTDPSQPVKFVFTFSEPVDGFDDADAVALTGTASEGATVTITEFAPNDRTTYEVSVTGMVHSGTVIADVNPDIVADIVGNPAGDSNVLDNEVLYDDQTNPTVTITNGSSQADPTRVGPIVFDVIFSEPVTGFGDDAGDVVISGTASGTKTAVVAGSGAAYQVSVSGMTSSGTVRINIPAGVAVDLSGSNYNDASEDGDDNVVTYDITSPSVVIEPAVGQDNPTGDSPIHFTVTFSEPVADFDDVTDVSTTGSMANPTASVVITQNSAYVYDVAVSGMTSSGTVIISIPAGAAQDAAGNLSLAGAVLDPVVYNRPGPAVTINQTDTQADPAKAAPIKFTVIFSSPVSDFTTGDVALGGTAGAIDAVVTDSGDHKTFSVAVSSMTQPGTVTVSIPADVAHDSNGHGNAASSSTDNQVSFDNIAPSVTISKSSDQVDPTKTLPLKFMVVFSERVSGFTKSGVAITGTAEGTKTITVVETSPYDGTTYAVTVGGITSQGTVIATVNAGAANDAAGNANTASASATITYDRKPLTPTISLAAGQADPANKSPINLKVVFSVATTDFATGDITLGGTAGATDAVVTDSGDHKTFSVAVSGMTKCGTVIASIDPSVAHSADGDGNTTSNLSISFDNAAPTIKIMSPTANDECTRNNAALKITGTASDNNEIESVKWSNSKGSTGTCTGTTSWGTGDITITGNGTDVYSDTIMLTVTDTAGNKATDTLKVNVNIQAPGSEWTSLAMVSVPIIPDETDPKLSTGFYSNSWVMFDTSANAYVQYPDKLTWFEPADQTPGRGFWARFGSTHGSPVGIIPAQNVEKTIHLKPGWNLIGNPFVKSVTWSFDTIQVEHNGIRSSLGEASDLVGNYAWGWNTTAESYYLVYDNTVLPDAVGELAPWQAYWVKAAVDCDLILPPPVSN